MKTIIGGVLVFYNSHGRMPSVRELSRIMHTKSMRLTYIAIERMIEEDFIFRDKDGKLQPKQKLLDPLI